MRNLTHSIIRDKEVDGGSGGSSGVTIASGSEVTVKAGDLNKVMADSKKQFESIKTSAGGKTKEQQEQEEGEEDINFGDFGDDFGIVTTTDPDGNQIPIEEKKVIEEPKKKEVLIEDKKIEDKKVEEKLKPVEELKEDLELGNLGLELPKKVEEKVEEDFVSTKDKPYPVSRDYSIFPEQDRDHMKHMGNETFAYLSKRLPELNTKIVELESENKQLKDAPPVIQQSNHPEAFKLTPEYKETINNVNVDKQLAQHWQQQLISLKNGAEQVINAQEQSDGKFISTPIAVTDDNRAQLEVQLGAAIQEANGAAQIGATKLTDIQISHSKEFDRVINEVAAYQQQIFPWEKNKDLLKSEVILQKGNKTTIGELKGKFKNMFGSQIQGEISFGIAENIFAHASVLAANNFRLTAEVNALRQNKIDQGSIIPKGKGKEAVAVVTEDDEVFSANDPDFK